MEIDKQQIVEALYKVKDPASGKDLISARMVENLLTEGNNVNFSLVLPSLNSPHKSNLIFDCVATIKEVYPQAEVNVHVATKTPDSQESASSVPQIKNIIAVASGKGGVGKSTVSVNLALGLQRLGAKVGLVDADLYGPSIPTMLGLQGQRPRIQDVHGQPKIIPLMAYDLPVMSIGFIIEPEQAVVLRGPRLGAIIKQFFNDVLWPDLDYLIVDLPPGTGDIQLTLVQTVPVTGAVMVTTPQEVAVADAVKAMNMFLLPSVNVPIFGVVENMAWFTPEDLPARKYFLFGEGGGKKLAQMSESMLLGQVPIVQGIREGGDNGKPVVLNKDSIIAASFMEIAENTAKQVALRNESKEPTKVVNVTG
ncbi:MAG: Mrp/NBP35 family ATP-binding protein [Saprospiraceae bacterium]|nr:Mrp/NBP35 family ATP-binding protein [Saprospiraceae bacterium]MCF8251413.1 Mrp/NBP35 family ATP-binding protein [Saprospiraceae bacterium]MCF8283058.1 Mrp/NBP35 family ATP-binding protein [Bacteroidales bacterium]MCF8312687.1 Mrp/NBP35 family ATP-binding protein [Saprospiraceae bacterium]MCF8441047.1 Mrp/NBP35 family ATP-binding protein [Saprospiraceae bacterium]